MATRPWCAVPTARFPVTSPSFSGRGPRSGAVPSGRTGSYQTRWAATETTSFSG